MRWAYNPTEKDLKRADEFFKSMPDKGFSMAASGKEALDIFADSFIEAALVRTFLTRRKLLS